MSREMSDAQRTRLEEILGGSDNVPADVYDPKVDFQAAYQRVEDADPELAQAWIDSLLPEGEEGDAPPAANQTLPAEREAKAAKRTAFINKVFSKIFVRQVGEEDSPTPTMADQRKIMKAAVAVLFVGGLVFLGIFALNDASNSTEIVDVVEESPTSFEPTTPAEPEPPVVEVPSEEEEIPVEPVAEEAEVEPEEPEPAEEPVVEPPAVEEPVFTNQSGDDLPPPPDGTAQAVAPPQGGVVYAAPAAGEARSGVVYQENAGADASAGGGQALVFSANEEQDRPTMVASRSAQDTLSSTVANQAVVFERERPTEEGGVRGLPTADDEAENVVYQANRSPTAPSGSDSLVFERTADDAMTSAEPATAGASPASESQVGNEWALGPTEAPATAVAPSPQSPSEDSALGAALANAGQNSSNQGTGMPGADDVTDTAAAEPRASTQPVSTRRANGSIFDLGERVPAHLVTSATILDGIPAPVIAETMGDWCAEGDCPTYVFIGEARLLGGDRVVINFTEVVTETGTESIDAIALSESMGTSIPAHIKDETPTIAPDLVRASLGGVAAYADQLTDQQRKTYDARGNIVVEDVPPTLETLIAGNAAKILDLPQGSSTVVRLAEIDPGTPVVIAMGLNY